MGESDEKIDAVLQKLEENPEVFDSAFTPVKRTTPARRSYETSRITAYPQVYKLDPDGEPAEWVGMFYDMEAAIKWVARMEGDSFLIERAPRRDLPKWSR